MKKYLKPEINITEIQVSMIASSCPGYHKWSDCKKYDICDHESNAGCHNMGNEIPSHQGFYSGYED